jgi:hypothetical protein
MRPVWISIACAPLRRGVDLRRIGVDEEADDHAAVAQAAHGVEHGRLVSRHVEPALGGDLLAALGHQAGVGRPQAAADGDHLRRHRHLQVDLGAHDRQQRRDVGILNVTAVFTQVHGDAVGAAALCRLRRFDHARIRRAARLADGGDVIDVHAEADHLATCGCGVDMRRCGGARVRRCASGRR